MEMEEIQKKVTHCKLDRDPPWFTLKTVEEQYLLFIPAVTSEEETIEKMCIFPVPLENCLHDKLTRLFTEGKPQF